MKARGFTLLEMLVASLIMAIAVVGLLSGIDTSVRNAARLTEHDRAAMLARAKMDELLTQTRLPLNTVMAGEFNPSLTGGTRGGWRARRVVFEKPPGIGGMLPITERLEVEVWWETPSGQRTYRLSTYRPAVLTGEENAHLPEVVMP